MIPCIDARRVMNKEFSLRADLSVRECEVLANEIDMAIRNESRHFVFHLVPDFLPSIGWLSRLAPLLAVPVGKKLTVEVTATGNQGVALQKAGIGLVADLVVK
jgi:hypothetical protein